MTRNPGPFRDIRTGELQMQKSAKVLSKTVQTAAGSPRLRLAIVLGSLTALGPLSIDMYLPALPWLARDLHTTASVTQLSLTMFLLGLASGQLFAGPFSDIRGRRLPLLAGIVLYTISSLLCALIPSVWALIVLRFLQGLAGAAGVAVSRAIVRDLYSGPELTRFVSNLMLVNGVAPVVAPIAGAQLLRVTSWQGVFIVLTVIGIGLFFAVFFGVTETLPLQCRSQGGISSTLSALRSVLLDRVFMGYALSQGFVAAALFAYIAGSPFVMQNIFGVSPQMFSLLFAINSFGIIVTSQITGRLAGIVSENKLFVTGIGMSFLGGIIVLAVVITGVGGLFAVIPPLFLVVSSIGIVASAGFSLAMQNRGHAAGTASGLLGVLSFISGAFVAPLVGIGGSHTAVPFGVVIATCGAASVLFYILLVRS